MNFLEAVKSNKNTIDDDTKVIFVSDLFVEDYSGGAELTTEALFTSAPVRTQKIRAREVTRELIDQNIEKIWIFGNMTMLNPALIDILARKCKYVILEYDYKFCGHRSIEKHAAIEKKSCDCHTRPIGDLIFTFFSNAQCIFWMSEKQQEIYMERFPDLCDTPQWVLSSVFDEAFFKKIHELRTKYIDFDRTEWLIQNSGSWIKGTKAGIEFCKEKSLPYREVANLQYSELLEELVKAKGFVFLPPGGDTCPRIVIEAKLLGCELALNDNVQHAHEAWFDTQDLDAVEEYLYGSRKIFWNLVQNEIIEKVPTLSGYTTTYNCISQQYPFEQCIKSMLGFCDEVVVVDGGSKDGTWEKLCSIQEDQVPTSERLVLFDCDESRRMYFNEKSPVKIHQIVRDWNSPRFAVFDGLQKAEARKLCMGDFCWQMDSDEVVHENDYEKVKNLVRQFPQGVKLISLPVIEYWGGPEKIRMDVTPWKWRLSRNVVSITHGIPAHLRKIDSDGNQYALEGTDGCDMIHVRTGESIPFVGFYSKEVDQIRMAALSGNEEARQVYQTWFQKVVDGIPSVYHFSWFDIPRKIRTYKNYWGKHWQSLFDKSVEDTADNNMFFDRPWSEVTNEMIDNLAEKLARECGGWIWHQKWNGKKTPHLEMPASMPALMEQFYGRKR